MKRILVPVILVVFAALGVFHSSALADGIIIPDPPICDGLNCPDPVRPIPIEQLNIRFHHVDITIQDQVAMTHVDQVFHNPNDWTIEGTYVFPIPLDAAVSAFTLWIDGEPVEGDILDADQARQTYEEIVRTMKDPALLEYADRGAVRARVFPIPPGGERRIELEYAQALRSENGLVRYQYPLNTEKFSILPLEEVRVSVDVRATVPLRAMYSPSHEVDVVRETANHYRAGYEEFDVKPDTDFVLYYSLGEEQAFHLLSYRDPSDPVDPDGFFLLLLAPRPDSSSEAVAKDVVLILDRSGSMEGEKFRQAKDALRYVLEHLNPEDRFNVISFSTGLETYARDLRPVTEAVKAIHWVERQAAVGSTDINRALLEAAALADRERPTYLIFLTDGLPTEGVTDSQRILDNLDASAPSNLRLFAFGVGYDVDTFLLDSLAENHHGTTTYVVPGERLDEILSAFYAKVSTPVMTDLALDFTDLPVYDVYPDPLPDLFVGSQIVVVGRYREGGSSLVTLTGDMGGEAVRFRFLDQQFTHDGRDKGAFLNALPRLWATRKIGHLLSQVRRYGPDQETVDQIVRLSIRYGIVTQYTSYLVTEPMPLGDEGQSRIVEEQFNQLQAMPEAPAYGRDAVEKAAEQGALQEAEVAIAPSADILDMVRIVGAHTFVYQEGIWLDTMYDPQEMDTVKVAFLSDDYFDLAAADPDLAAAFALGPGVVALADGVAYEVVESDERVDPVQIPPTQTPVSQVQVPTVVPVSTANDVVSPGLMPGTVSCLGGLLPLLLLPLGLVLFHTRKF